MNERYTLSDLLTLMARLRKPKTGCSWDLKQNFRSITPSTIEEVYEVVDAIEREDFAQLREELGDLLFQIVFYSQLAAEDGRFDFADIIDGLTAKLLRRHPHVFPDGTLHSERTLESALETQQVAVQWEQLKRREREMKGQHSVLDDVPLALPSLPRAQKLQKRVSRVGMDWADLASATDKIDEELAELREAIAADDREAFQEELGDLFFSCVNVARLSKLDAESVLRAANAKFEQRIRSVEAALARDGRDWMDCGEKELDDYWRAAKSSPTNE